MRFSPVALVALLVVNLLPLAGVVVLDWAVYEVLTAYWLESGVVGLYNLLRMATAGRKAGSTWNDATFFVVHYGLFWLAFGVFLEIAFFPPASVSSSFFPWDLPWSPALAWTLVGMIVSHGLSYARNWWAAGERLDKASGDLFFAPYRRIAVLLVAVFAAGYGLQEVGESTYGVIALVVMKIVLDVAAHLWEHARARRTSRGQGGRVGS